MLPWVSSAPFGSPVVPEVYWISAVSCWRARLRRLQPGRRRHDRGEQLDARRAPAHRAGRLLEQGRRQRQARAARARSRDTRPARPPRPASRARTDSTISRPAWAATSTRAPESSSSCWSSMALCMGFSGTVMAPALSVAEVRDRELGAVLEIERDAVARPDAAGAEPAREAIARVVELGEGDRAPVEDDGRLARGARRVALEEGGDRLAGKPDARLVEAGRPVRSARSGSWSSAGYTRHTRLTPGRGAR